MKRKRNPSFFACHERLFPIVIGYVILIRIRNGINDPLPSSDGLNNLGARLQLTQSLDELIFQCIEAIKGAVVEMLFS